MANTKKISELPQASDTDGLMTLGVNNRNESVKVSLGQIISDFNTLKSSVGEANSKLGKILLDSSCVSDMESIGTELEQLPQVEMAGYYDTSGLYHSHADWSTRIYDVNQDSCYKLRSQMTGNVVCNVVLFDGEIVVGWYRGNVWQLIRPTGYTRIGLTTSTASISTLKLCSKVGIKADRLSGVSVGTAKIEKDSVVTEKIMSGSVDASKLGADIVTSPNLFDKDSPNNVIGRYYANGRFYDTVTNYNTTDFMPVEPGESYVCSYNGAALLSPRFVSFLDSGGTFMQSLDQTETGTSVFTAPESARYMRVSAEVGQWPYLQIEKGTSPSGKKDYSPKIRRDMLQLSGVEVSLPDRIYAVVGDTLQLFFRGIIKAVDPYSRNILVTCQKGNQYPRYFEYTPSASDIGTVSLKVEVRDDDLTLIASKECQLVTVAAPSSPSRALKVACFGDSLTSGGIWPAEAYRRLTASGGSPVGAGLSSIEFVGQMSKDGAGYFGVGGWAWENYTTAGSPAYRFQVSGVSALTVGAKYSHGGNTFTVMEVNTTGGSGNILCSVASLSPIPSESGTLTKVSGTGDSTITFSSVSQDSANPLWDSDNGKMSFVPYADTYAGGQIDVVYVLLSWNRQTAGRTDFSSVITQVKKFADTLHSEFPSAKLKIMGLQLPSLNGGMGRTYGATGEKWADQYGMVVTVLNQNKAYQDFANSDGYSEFVEFVNISAQFDSEYNMPQSLVPVNTRNSQTEYQGTNGVHPSTAGYLQIGDAVYRNFVANYCNS